MDTKICKICKIEKDIDQFPKTRCQCKICYSNLRKDRYNKDIENKRESSKASYYRNREERIKKASEYQKNNPEKRKAYSKKNRVKAQDKWREWKSTLSCEKCGENHPSCLEFHHLDSSQKEGLISKMRFSKIKLESELKKCIILCSNCHRKEHWNY